MGEIKVKVSFWAKVKSQNKMAAKKAIGHVDNNTPPKIFWAHLDRCPLSLSLSSGSRQCQGLLLSFQLLQSSANAFYLQLLRVQKYLMLFPKLDQNSFLISFQATSIFIFILKSFLSFQLLQSCANAFLLLHA